MQIFALEIILGTGDTGKGKVTVLWKLCYTENNK